jgi:predicted kinase
LQFRRSRFEIHALDVPEKVLRKNNSGRKMAVPDAVIDRMISKWKPPTPLEAHGLVWIGEDLEPIPDAIRRANPHYVSIRELDQRVGA